MCSCLFIYGAEIEQKSKRGHDEAARWLLENGADVNATGLRSIRELHRAIDQRHEIAQVVLEHGANVNLKDDDGWTALHGAAACGEIGVAKLILRLSNANLKDRDNAGYTPLQRAAAEGYAKTVELLAWAGASTESMSPVI